jgi:DNA repair protein RecN (Recombination protein N)
LLTQIRMNNFVLVESLELDLSPGLNVLTGETGAGKSLVVDAISLLLGARASTQYIRTGAEKAVVEGFFQGKNPLIDQSLAEMGLQPEAEGLLLSREIAQNGKNVSRINGKIFPLSMYQILGNLLVDIHGQHEQQSLLSPQKQLELLDRRGTDTLSTIKETLAAIYDELEQVQMELDELQGDPVSRERQKDLYRYQLQEIELARLREKEEEELLYRRNLLANAEKLLSGVEETCDLLFRGSRGNSAYDQLSQCINRLESLLDYDDSLKGPLVLMESALYQLEEAVRELQGYADRIEFEPKEREQIEQRLELINNLKRKYGPSIKDILQYGQEAASALERLEQSEELVQRLMNRKTQLIHSYEKVAGELTDLRRQLARELEKEVQLALQELQMKGARFQIQFSVHDSPRRKGLDEVEYLISPNPGEPLKPLSKIASGGEIARIMLALKSILAQVDDVETVVFDEADSGIGGLAAASVAQKIFEIARTRQVICITHSPQIASFADSHFVIFKERSKGRTYTRVKRLSQEERIRELARMLGGSANWETAVEHAKELLHFASRQKS